MSKAFSAGCAWVEGHYVPIAEARIPLTDMGFTRSDGTYDVVAAWHGKFFRLALLIAGLWLFEVDIVNCFPRVGESAGLGRQPA